MEKKLTSFSELLKIDVQQAVIMLDGTAPLLMSPAHFMGRRDADRVDAHAAAELKSNISPAAELITSFYWVNGAPPEFTDAAFDEVIKSGKARFGFPARAFKQSVVQGLWNRKLIKNKVTLNGMFHVCDELAIIDGKPDRATTPLTTKKGEEFLRCVGVFPEWSVNVRVEFNADVVSLEQLASMFDVGGEVIGVGDKRPEQGGTYGTYRVSKFYVER